MTAKHSFEEATRVLAGDDRTGYDRLAISLHWATAVLVVVQFVLAETWSWFPVRATRRFMVAMHMSFGIVLTAVVIARIAWRLIPGHQIPPAVSGWVELAAKGVHYLLYGLIAAEAVLGFALGWGWRMPMSFFGLQIPPPFPPFARTTNQLIAHVHHLNGWAIMILAGGHAASALFHHYVVRDRVLVRMLPLVGEPKPRPGSREV